MLTAHSDPFKFMRERNKVYGWVIAFHEFERTIPTLWNITKSFFKQRPELLHPNNAARFLSNNAGLDGNYNLCMLAFPAYFIPPHSRFIQTPSQDK